MICCDNLLDKRLSYSAQDAVKEFLGKPLAFRISMDICYKIDAPEGAVRIKVFQNKKEIFPESYDSSPYYYYCVINGENNKTGSTQAA